VSALAVLLIAIGAADICRRVTRRRWLPVAVAPAAVLVCALLAGLWHRGDLPLLLIAAAAGVAWQVLGARAERTGERPWVPLLALGAAMLAVIVLSGWSSEVAGMVGRWSTWTRLPGVGELTPDRLLMVVAVVLLQLVTGNQLVRLVLASVGAVKPAGQPQASDRLKGGRLLGPMERLLILGLGLAGQLAAATAVVAAKSIIRFPEINAQKARENGNGDLGIGIDEVTEYFLVGSFASWIIALGGLALAQ
jgi:membrane protease YdiL (CAAX protease family)